MHPLEPRRLFDAGFLDTQFNQTGTAITDFRGVRESAQAVLPMADGRVVVVGGYRVGDNVANDWDGFALLRHNADGTFDTTFGAGGAVRARGPSGLDITVSDAVLQPDGKIVVLGSGSRRTPSGSTPSGLVLARFNADGSFDTSFGTGGVLETNRIETLDGTGGLTLLPTGQVLVGGVVRSQEDGQQYTQIATARFTANGTFDEAYGTLGVATLERQAGNFTVVSLLWSSTSATTVVAQGRGLDVALIGKFLANGTPVEAFGDDGQFLLDDAPSIPIDAALSLEGDVILVGGSPDSAFRIAKLTDGDTLDLAFGADGDNNGYIDVPFSGPAFASSVVVQSDGKIVVAGRRTRTDTNPDDNRFALTRLNADGSVDGTWGDFGKTAVHMGANTYDEAYDVAVGADGGIYAVGASVPLNGNSFGPSRMAVARFWRTEAPQAFTGPRTVTKPGATGINFSVVYRDDGLVNQATLNNADIQILAPDGVLTYKARFLGAIPQLGGGVWIANYRLAAPGGSFDAADNGVYRIKLRSNQVADTEGNFAVGRTLGTIIVNIAGASPVMAGAFSSTRVRATDSHLFDTTSIEDEADPELLA